MMNNLAQIAQLVRGRDPQSVVFAMIPLTLLTVIYGAYMKLKEQIDSAPFLFKR